MNAKQRAALLVLVIVVVAGATWWLGRADQKPADNGAVAETSAAASASVAAGPASESPRTRDHSENDTQHIADDGTAPVPRRYQIAGVTQVQTAASFEDWMAHFSEADQAILRDFNKRNHGVYRVHNPETVAWMAQNGYPMPEDVLAAQGLSSETLRDLVKEGNVKAAFLLKSRNVAEINAKVALSDGKLNKSTVYENNPQYFKDLLRVKHLLKTANSPYKAFLEAQEASLMTGQDSRDAKILAALVWAKHLGDFRSGRLVDRFIVSDRSRVDARQKIYAGVISMSLLYSRAIAEFCPRRIGVSSQNNPTVHYYPSD